MKHPFVLAITGASGVLYAVRLLEVMLRRGCHVHLTISSSGCVVLQQELGVVVDLERFSLRDLTQPAMGDGNGAATDMQLAAVEMLQGLEAAIRALAAVTAASSIIIPATSWPLSPAARS